MKVYFVETNAGNSIMYVNEITNTAKVNNYSPSGIFNGIDITSDNKNAISELKKYFNNNIINNYEDIYSDEDIDYSEIKNFISQYPNEIKITEII